MPKVTRLLGKQLWCLDCLNKIPKRITKAEHLVYVKHSPYEFATDTVNIDNRLCGVCDNCLKGKNAFQKQYKQAVDINNPNLIRKSV